MENSNVTPLVPKDKNAKEENSLVSSLSPREIVSELDRFVVGQNKAKKAVAVALRNRWRRQALKGEMKNDHPIVFLECSVTSPLLCAMPRKTYPKVSSSGRTVKSTVYNLKPSDIREIRIKKNTICFFSNYYFLI